MLRSAQALTNGHVITVRKSMLLDLRLHCTFISLAAGQTHVEDRYRKNVLLQIHLHELKVVHTCVAR